MENKLSHMSSSLVVIKMELGCPVMWMILLCIVLCCNHSIVEAIEKLENVEDLEIEQRLKLINKPAVKIIKSIYGERYGCVDFYKQPGFDHPSMKDHKFHYKMRLTSYPKRSKMQRKTMSNRTFGHLWENGVGCPIGTVPILRVKKNDLLRLKSFDGNNFNPRGSSNNTYQPMSSGNGHHFAVVRTKGKPKSYNGASMNIAIKTPLVEPNQYSSGRLCIQFGNELLQAGWIVNQRLYGDARSRLYVFIDAGGNACYNSACSSGMITVRQDIPLGIPLDQQTKKRIDIDIAIIKDQKNGNWWLTFNNTREEIGFWPASRFKESSGTLVEWGGEVFSPSLIPSPPMGNGKFPTGDPHVDAYIRRLSIVDGNYKTDDVVRNTETYSDNTRGYKVRDTTESWWIQTGHLLIYGGPGKI